MEDKPKNEDFLEETPVKSEAFQFSGGTMMVLGVIVIVLAVGGVILVLMSGMQTTANATATAAARAQDATTAAALVPPTREPLPTPTPRTFDETFAPEEILEKVTAQEYSGTPTEICDAAITDEPNNRSYEAAEEVLEDGVDYRAIFCTESGPIYVNLFEDQTPVTVNSFVFLARRGYYNNTFFHRVLDGFMAQGGDPTNTGGGSPGYQFKDEFVGYLDFDRPGLLAMANANNPQMGIMGTNGSQFFITTVPTQQLNNRHTIFGMVLEGQENVESLKLRDPSNLTDLDPGSELRTVVIISDPSKVTATAPALETATLEQVSDAFNAVDVEFSGLIDQDPEHSSVVEREAIITALPEASREAYGALLDEHGWEFRQTHRMVNPECSEQIPFTWVSYTIDAFASAEDVTAVIESGLLYEIAEANGYTNITTGELPEREPVAEATADPEATVEAEATADPEATAEAEATEEPPVEPEPFDTREAVPYDIYAMHTTGCNDMPEVYATTFLQRGRYLVTAELIYPASIFPPTTGVAESSAIFVTQIVLNTVFEPAFTDIYLPEID